MDGKERQGTEEGPVWLVRAAIILLFLAFAAFLAREVTTVLERLS